MAGLETNCIVGIHDKGGRILKLSSPKEGAAVSTRPMFRWPLENGESTAYELLLTDAQNNVTTISPLVCGAVGVACRSVAVRFQTARPYGRITVVCVNVVGVFAHKDALGDTVLVVRVLRDPADRPIRHCDADFAHSPKYKQRNANQNKA